VYILEDHKAPLATVQIWYRVGSIDEPAGKTGISHLLEHMMFKGTPKYGSKVFSNIVQRNGGSDNAYTTKDYTMYFQTIASDRIGISIELEADRMKNLLLDPKETVSRTLGSYGRAAHAVMTTNRRTCSLRTLLRLHSRRIRTGIRSSAG
jgi:zinc protease